MAVYYRQTAHPTGQRLQAGFGITGLAIVVILMGLLIVPLLRLTASSVGGSRVQQTQAALDTAADALIAFAAANNGCLPFASDDEGGYPDTDNTGSGSAGYFDTGVHDGITKRHSADLPWGDLGLTNALLDSDGLRIQYYPASLLTDQDADYANPQVCKARFHGFMFKNGVQYEGTPPNPIWVYYDVAANDRHLYKIIGTYPIALTPPEAATSDPNVSDETNPFPASLLEVRRGPDVLTGTLAETAVVSARNAFVLIAPGTNRNAALNRLFVRDSTHVDSATSAPWSLDDTFVDDVIFSMTPNVDTTNEGNSGDDTLLVMSFIQYKAELSRYGLNMEPMCDADCSGP